MNNPYFDETEVRKAIAQLYPNGDAFEVRIIGKKKMQPSAYFKDVDNLIKGLEENFLQGCNAYITLNQLKPEIYERDQQERFMSGVNTTSDADIDGYKWLFVDLDPVRPSGISSSDEELEYAKQKLIKVGTYLHELGFERPIQAMSGNGYHLLYRINLANNEENRQLIKKCLEALSMLFSDEKIKIDVVNFNPSRICKLYGTLAQKGSGSDARPHRMSKILGDVRVPEVTDKAFLEKLASELPQETIKPTPQNNYNPHSFDIEEWMGKYGIQYKDKVSFHDGFKYVLKECPFDANHKAPDSMITVAGNGAIGFKCLHNSCANHKWKDLRLMFEPNAYEYNENDKRIEEGFAQFNHNRPEPEKPKQEDGEAKFLTMLDILNKDYPDPEYVRTGINIIDKTMLGLEKGKISVVSGLRGSGKSTLLGQIILNAINEGYHVVGYSGELSDKSFANWIMKQAAGKDFVSESAKMKEHFFVDKELMQRIGKWMGEKFWLFDNESTLDLQKIIKGLRIKINESKADLVIIDNLMSLDIGSLDRMDKYNAQTQFLWELKHMAEMTNSHIVLVAHPRKATGFLRMDDISGTSNIGNIVDNAFIVHRVDEDFKRLSKQTLGWKDDHRIYNSNCTNCVEIAKDRENGTRDVFVPLYYEPQSKQMLNYANEVHHYGWRTDQDGFIPEEDSMETIPF